MKRFFIGSLAMLLIGLGVSFAWSCGGYGPANDIFSPDQTERLAAIEELRAEGPFGLQQLHRLKEQRLRMLAQPTLTAEQRQRFQNDLTVVDAAMDEVGGAKYCSVSNLYWYTDLEQAKAVAKQVNKPILSLRMLGKLNEEFSCANSRFFRTSLYANQAISQTMRDKFVLHWQSVRPVPKVTIDFGDGRKLERTLTGNSIHYVLDSAGRPLDGLPGLHGPQAFAAWLGRTETLHAQLVAQPENHEQLLAQYHQARLTAIDQAWRADLAKLSLAAPEPQNNQQQLAQVPPSKVAMVRAMPKMRAEMPILREVKLADRPLPESLESLTDQQWNSIAALHAEDAALDRASIELIRSQNPDAVLAGKLSISKAFVEDPIMRMVRTFQSSIALDTVRNEYVLHRQLHNWFVANDGVAEIDPLNERVYAQLFLTPSSDPWLGLVPRDTYTALKNDGRIVDAK